MTLSKSQVKFLEAALEERMRVQGVQALINIPRGSIVQKWSVSRNAAEVHTITGKPVQFKILSSDRARMKGYLILSYEQDGLLHMRQTGFHERDHYKIIEVASE